MKSNQINFLPPEIGRLKNCVKMDVSHNMLSELPWEMGELTNLNMLNVDHNPLLMPPKPVINQGTKAIVDWLAKNEKTVRLFACMSWTNSVTYLSLCTITGSQIQDIRIGNGTSVVRLCESYLCGLLVGSIVYNTVSGLFRSHTKTNKKNVYVQSE